MKLRKIELKEIEMTDEVFNDTTKEFETKKQGKFVYREILRQIITGPGKAGQVSSEEVIKSVMIYGKIKEALVNKKDHFFVDQEEYDYIRGRLEGFPWAIAHSVIAEFIKYIRELKETEVEVTAKSEAATS